MSASAVSHECGVARFGKSLFATRWRFPKQDDVSNFDPGPVAGKTELMNKSSNQHVWFIYSLQSAWLVHLLPPISVAGFFTSSN